MRYKKTLKEETKKQKLNRLKLEHWKWIKSLGVAINLKTGKIKNIFKGYSLPDYKVRNSVPLGNRIPGACVKRKIVMAQLPEGKTISIGYNKGTYQVVDKSDFKSMGRKI
jgi:hypothetical protein